MMVMKGYFITYFELSASYKFHQNGFRTDLSNVRLDVSRISNILGFNYFFL